MHNLFHIRCTIERGGFSGERTFEISLGDGDLLVGTASVEYLCDENKGALSDDEPPFGTKLNGYVRCRKVREEGGSVIVEVPSADLIRVPAAELEELRC